MKFVYQPAAKKNYHKNMMTCIYRVCQAINITQRFTNNNLNIHANIVLMYDTQTQELSYQNRENVSHECQWHTSIELFVKHIKNYKEPNFTQLFKQLSSKEITTLRELHFQNKDT